VKNLELEHPIPTKLAGPWNHGEIKYLVISPVRNEAEHIEKTIVSILNQTIKPKEWIIVDDGSKDRTYEIVKKYSEKYEWIKIIRRGDRGYAEPGRGVMEAFYAGFDNRTCNDFDFIVKLDGDLGFDKNYFESLFNKFSENPKLGLAGGVCYIKMNGRLEPETHPEFHVRGPTKVYRRECWEDIGGLIKHLGWDTIDEIAAQYHGWETRSFKDLKVIHYKITGNTTGAFKWAIKCGKGNYYCGYHPLFVLAKGVRRMILRQPYLFNGIGVILGFFSCYLRKEDRYEDLEIIKYLRKEQIKKLLFRPGIWR
jgi:biofilm PGA synthesis N-glycosyltransferase PgaC